MPSYEVQPVAERMETEESPREPVGKRSEVLRDRGCGGKQLEHHPAGGESRGRQNGRDLPGRAIEHAQPRSASGAILEVKADTALLFLAGYACRIRDHVLRQLTAPLPGFVLGQQRTKLCAGPLSHLAELLT
ncbi:MAG TPA: hypothetical protein VGY97_08965 [Solirubrobacteraceae bacterium]|nr:hypothetical protein [Solirubrobacteraceae bacterium]